MERVQNNTIYAGYGPLFTGERKLLDYLISEFEHPGLGAPDQTISFDMAFVVKAKAEATTVSKQNHSK